LVAGERLRKGDHPGILVSAHVLLGPKCAETDERRLRQRLILRQWEVE
jgi:hypothetical protein